MPFRKSKQQNFGKKFYVVEAWYNHGTIMVRVPNGIQCITFFYADMNHGTRGVGGREKFFSLSFPATKFCKKVFRENFSAALRQVVHPNKTVAAEVQWVCFLPGQDISS